MYYYFLNFDSLVLNDDIPFKIIDILRSVVVAATIILNFLFKYCKPFLKLWCHESKVFFPHHSVTDRFHVAIPLSSASVISFRHKIVMQRGIGCLLQKFLRCFANSYQTKKKNTLYRNTKGRTLSTACCTKFIMSNVHSQINSCYVRTLSNTGYKWKIKEDRTKALRNVILSKKKSLSDHIQKL